MEPCVGGNPTQPPPPINKNLVEGQQCQLRQLAHDSIFDRDAAANPPTLEGVLRSRLGLGLGLGLGLRLGYLGGVVRVLLGGDLEDGRDGLCTRPSRRRRQLVWVL